MITKTYIHYLESEYTGDKWFDKAIKDVSVEETNGLFKLFKIPYCITTFERTEHTTIRKGERRADLVGRNGWEYFVHIEGSKQAPYYYDFLREIEYGLGIYMGGWRAKPKKKIWKDKNNYAPVLSVFLTAGKIKDEDILIDYQNKNRGNEIILRSFYNLDAENILNKIITKVENNEQLGWDEVQFLKFIVSTNLKMENHEKILTAIKILNKDQSIADEIKEKIIINYISNTIIDVVGIENKIKIIEEISMSSIKEFVENALINAKKAEEREIGKMEVAKALLDRGDSPEEVAKVTGLSLNVLMKL